MPALSTDERQNVLIRQPSIYETANAWATLDSARNVYIHKRPRNIRKAMTQKGVIPFRPRVIRSRRHVFSLRVSRFWYKKHSIAVASARGASTVAVKTASFLAAFCRKRMRSKKERGRRRAASLRIVNFNRGNARTFFARNFQRSARFFILCFSSALARGVPFSSFFGGRENGAGTNSLCESRVLCGSVLLILCCTHYQRNVCIKRAAY